jgi:hypothetical protein
VTGDYSPGVLVLLVDWAMAPQWFAAVQCRSAAAVGLQFLQVVLIPLRYAVTGDYSPGVLVDQVD